MSGSIGIIDVFPGCVCSTIGAHHMMDWYVFVSTLRNCTFCQRPTCNGLEDSWLYWILLN